MDDNSEYNDTNRAFLQALMGRGSLTFEQGQQVLASILSAESGDDVKPDSVTQDDFEAYINIASDAVSLYDYQIRSALHQVTKERSWALVNTASDPTTQLATTFTADEISFIKRVLDAIFDTYNTPRMEKMCVTIQEAITLSRPPRSAPDASNAGEASQAGSTDRGLRHSDVNRVMDELVAAGWLEKSVDGFYAPAPRALMELRTWLLDTYNDPDAPPDEWQRVKSCEACKEVVTHGQRCSERDCPARIHDICEVALWRARRARTCPRCERDWTGDKFVGERAVTSTKAYRQAKGRGRKSNTLASDIFDAAQAEEGEEEEEQAEEEEGN
ncbi:related to DNA repair protein Nse1 [Cephalotrichum gorgonifer]|uniref:Non-structural maintenance of chromosomes element 1 homolog n=1 Tax=Cephalotrichum gorgonifer TaxID=2041049 RepID=A0AAE8MRE4_9PEZI|nr:related to DNA repair protein Nse1 [Cephalotrichum gorgonifer]